MDTQLLMKTAMLAGKIMIYSGAETYRVEDTMHHIFKTAENLENAEVLVVMTGITATLKLKNKKAVTSVTRVENHGTNLSHVVNVNDISRRYCGSEITLEEAYKELQSLRKKEYKQIEHCIGQVGVCIGFAIFFGGSIWDVLATCGVGLFLALCDLAGKDLSLIHI